MILQRIRALRSHNSSYRVGSITACKQPLHWRGRVYRKSQGMGGKHGERRMKRDQERVILLLYLLFSIADVGTEETYLFPSVREVTAHAHTCT